MDVIVAVSIARIAVGAVLFAAGLSKIRRLKRFRGALDASRLFSAPGAALVMVGVPAAELLLPVWLVVSINSIAAAWAVIAVLAAFTAYVFVLRVLKRDPSCGCFGGAGKISDPMVARNVGLMALVGAGIDPALAVFACAAGVVLLLYWVTATMRHVSRVAARAAART